MKQYHLTNSFLLLLLSTAMAGCDSNNTDTPVSAPSSPVQEMLATTSSEAAQVQVAASTSNDVIELDWDALIPADWRLDKLMDEYSADSLSDDDPRAKELMEKLKRFWKEAPVVHDYDGKIVKLPGFVVPLETDTKTIQEFLLVPYYGACIHTPPPPANQTVYVVTDEDHAYRGQLFDTVWVTGTLDVDKRSSELGDAGYRIDARTVEPYQ
ncbi:MAG: hypothetical protein B0D96_09995 [Candidatus Sedimenticola endophacoides]|nr:MAG: hypothetical protein B0D96_09995 [Candidatus Sedimenticola endophacoides]OQX48718.1 MAG: hypothetical protein B0D87_04275 [Candidatus Sedimenticola endophacoides]